jgi:hypothetical protein
MFFAIGDYVAGMIIGVATTLAVRVIVWPGAMLLGMAAGMLLHFVVGLILAPLLGMFETMMPGSLIGMYGGMLFGMRDSMAAGSITLSAAVIVGAIFGAVVVAGVKVYGRVLGGRVWQPAWIRRRDANGTRRAARSISSPLRKIVGLVRISAGSSKR